MGSALASSDLATRAAGAARLAAADRAASKATLKIKAEPRRAKALQGLAAAIAAEAGALDGLGSAIHGRDHTAYRSARAGVRKAEASMKHSLAALKVAGYGTKKRTAPGAQPEPADRVVDPPGEEGPHQFRREHGELELGIDRRPLPSDRWRRNHWRWRTHQSAQPQLHNGSGDTFPAPTATTAAR